MRYWAVVGLRLAHEKRLPSEATKAALTRLADGDDSPAVRIAAAHALCKWGQANKGLPVLAAGLDSAQPSLQLNAAQALEDLGEQARPLLPRLKQLAAKSSEYVQRVTANVVEQLETTH
jgi:HEAT repeat protein